jgi:DNA polymerase-1
VRTKLGREVRSGFVASSGKKLISIDYSQIELRLLAHFCQDDALLQAFVEGQDIHLQTAIKIFGEEKAQENRHIAKTINFGLIYGMGARKLAQTLEIDNKTAKSYIDSYFASFPTVKEFIANEEQKVQEIGYVQTISGRKRYFDFDSANKMQQASFLREAVNSIFQGSASDIIKLAMNKIEKLYKNDDDIKMLLQIHDELIFEVDEQECDRYSDELTDIMQDIVSLKVPLIVGVSVGDNWGELK